MKAAFGIESLNTFLKGNEIKLNLIVTERIALK
jgi:hypothetical protein